MELLTMIIEMLTIKNFRQFLGSHKLTLSTDPFKNVTVVHGSNGSGKTSLLNAFKWCFYGETDFDTLNDNILNEAAIQQANEGDFIELSVDVNFIQDEKRYYVRRAQTFKCLGPMNTVVVDVPQLTIDITEKDGQTKRSKSPNVDLLAILPKDLQPYFFFNGERIEHIASVNQSVQIQDAIRKLMGLELVERAITHLDKAKNQYRKELRSTVSEEHQQLHDQVLLEEEKIKLYEDNIVKHNRREEESEAIISKLERDLKQYEESRALQRKAEELGVQLDQKNNEKSAVKSEQVSLLNKKAFLVLSEEMFTSCSRLVERNRKKGVLPYGIKEQFVEDLIDIGSCICGTLIKSGSAEHEHLLDVKRSAGNDNQESVYTSVSTILNLQKDEVRGFKDDYDKASNKLINLNRDIEFIQNELDDISALLSKHHDTKISDLEKEKLKQKSIHYDAATKKGIALSNLEDSKNTKKSLENKLEALEDQKSQQNISNLRMKKASFLVEKLKELRESLSNQIRIQLSSKVDSTFQSIIRKPVRAIIDDNYKLQILKKDNTGEEYVVSEQSTGERQVTSLSFIASIIALAKEKHGKKGLFINGGLYPLVMDSPFGALDDDYREKVASCVSDMAEQVIVFVSNSQWQGKVKAACEPKMGKSYQLVYHSPTVKENTENEYVRSSANGFEYTTLKEA